MKRSGLWRIAVGVVLLAALLPGCKKKSKPDAAATSAPAAPQGLPPGGLQPAGANPGVMSTLPSVGRTNPGNDLKQIGLYYLNFATTGRSPSWLEDLADLKRDLPRVYQAIQDGVYVVYWNAPTTGASSQAVLAYVHDVPTRGGMVLLLDGSVTQMSPQEFQAAPRAGR
jgi:hypothetical protein